MPLETLDVLIGIELLEEGLAIIGRLKTDELLEIELLLEGAFVNVDMLEVLDAMFEGADCLLESLRLSEENLALSKPTCLPTFPKAEVG